MTHFVFVYSDCESRMWQHVGGRRLGALQLAGHQGPESLPTAMFAQLKRHTTAASSRRGLLEQMQASSTRVCPGPQAPCVEPLEFLLPALTVHAVESKTLFLAPFHHHKSAHTHP